MRAKARRFRPSQLSTLNSQLPFTFFPPSPHQPEHKHLACGSNGHLVRCFRHSRLQTCWPRTKRLAQWEVVSQLQQRNCSRFARDFLRRSTFSSSQRTKSRSSGLRSALQDLFNRLCPRLVLLPICSSPAELVSSAPISHAPCKKNFRAHGSQ